MPQPRRDPVHGLSPLQQSHPQDTELYGSHFWGKVSLGGILTYHVVPGLAPSDALRAGQQVATLQGSPVTVTLEGGQIRINNAKVVVADIQASNGIIHVIDAVLIPPR
ncbi:fasciclin domain-containing protein [Synechococcus sp. R6-10]|uniref:fasciclin domain-containing protein n=1 Tax=Synechococcus sp. R6-10 TaxID=2291956 RepID=UPI0039C1F5CA